METGHHPVLVEGGDPVSDSRAFRRCLGQFATGVTVMTAQEGGQRVGVTANSFSSLSIDPPLILWSVARNSRSFPVFEKASHFAVNILSAGQIEQSQHFSSKREDKFAGVDWEPGQTGAPVLKGIAALLECRLETTYEGGDHLILVGRVEHYARYSGEVLVFAQGRYGLTQDHPDIAASRKSQPRTAGGPEEALPPLGVLLSEADRHYAAGFAEHREAVGLTFAQSRVLHAIKQDQSLSFDAIVECIHFPAMIVKDVIADLVENKLLAADLEGGFSITQAGMERREAIQERGEAYEAERLSGFTEAELTQARQFLAKLVATMEQHSG